MRSTFAAVLLIAMTACLPAAQGGGVDWPTVAKCGPDVDDLVSTISHILLSESDPKPALEQQAAKHGENLVVCLVDTLMHDWTAPGSAPEPHRLQAAGRAQRFLDGIGTRIEHVGEPDATHLPRWLRPDRYENPGFKAQPDPQLDQRPWRSALAHARGLS